MSVELSGGQLNVTKSELIPSPVRNLPAGRCQCIAVIMSQYTCRWVSVCSCYSVVVYLQVSVSM